jgi:hypothetical protein
MSLPLPCLFHWSPEDRRERIIQRGLKPSTPTAVENFDETPTGPRKLLPSVGFTTVKAVCLGTTPSHAWALCGALWGQAGETWDLWQVTLAQDDQVHVLPIHGYRIGELRVLNRIPKSRIWHVGTRVVGARRWSHA